METEEVNFTNHSNMLLKLYVERFLSVIHVKMYAAVSINRYKDKGKVSKTRKKSRT